MHSLIPGSQPFYHKRMLSTCGPAAQWPGEASKAEAWPRGDVWSPCTFLGGGLVILELMFHLWLLRQANRLSPHPARGRYISSPRTPCCIPCIYSPSCFHSRFVHLMSVCCASDTTSGCTWVRPGLFPQVTVEKREKPPIKLEHN